MIGRSLRTALDRVAFALALGETGLDPRIDTSLTVIALDVTGCGLLAATDRVDGVRDPLLAGEVVVTVCGHAIRLATLVTARRSPPSSDRSRSKEGGRRARCEMQEGVETVPVSQVPAISEAPAAVVPPVGGATIAVFPSAVQDLARFFLNLAGSSSLGAVGGVAGMAASALGVGAQLCPPALGGEVVTSCAATAVPAGVVGPPAASAAVPGSSGRQEFSCSNMRRSCSSSDGTGRAMKKRHRGRRSRSSRRREKFYRSSSESSEDDRAEDSPPMSGRAPGGTPGDSRPAPAGDRSPHPGPSGWMSRSSAGAEWYRPGVGGRLSPLPSGTVTVPVPLMQWTLTGMTLSGLSWASSRTSTTWKSWQVSHQLDARLLLHRSMG